MAELELQLLAQGRRRQEQGQEEEGKGLFHRRVGVCWRKAGFPCGKESLSKLGDNLPKSTKLGVEIRQPGLARVVSLIGFHLKHGIFPNCPAIT
jgi:hypothetical protein